MTNASALFDDDNNSDDDNAHAHGRGRIETLATRTDFQTRKESYGRQTAQSDIHAGRSDKRVQYLKPIRG